MRSHEICADTCSIHGLRVEQIVGTSFFVEGRYETAIETWTRDLDSRLAIHIRSSSIWRHQVSSLVAVLMMKETAVSWAGLCREERKEQICARIETKVGKAILAKVHISVIPQ
jgi:hypothetical protein